MGSRFFCLASAVISIVAGAGCAGGSGSLPAGPATTATLTHGVIPAARKKRLGMGVISAAGCPEQAVFVRLPGEIRGYPLASSGPAMLCTDIAGPQTLLTGNGNGYGALAVSVHGDLHALSFQSNAVAGGLMVFAPGANGNAAPFRPISVGQDHVALALDSQVNDYVVASENYSGDNCWYVVPIGSLSSSGSNCDPSVGAIAALAVTPRDELVVLGADIATGATRVDIFANPATATPVMVRSLTGPATGLPVTTNYFAATFSLATDPIAGTIYVLANAGAQSAPVLSEFAAGATGNTPPVRTLSGPLTQLPAQTFAINVLSVDSNSNLYVNATGSLEPAIRIAIFAPGATGNSAPTSVIEDDSLVDPGSGGIAVRDDFEPAGAARR